MLMLFVAATCASAGGKRVDYKQRLETWLEQLLLEKEKPNTKQLQVLKAVKDRLLLEVQLENEGPELRRKHQPHLFSTDSEEPIRALIHGLPGTGKSRVITWIRRMFMEARDWTHGVQFLCVAFQNKVAYAMGGSTLHCTPLAICLSVDLRMRGSWLIRISMKFSRKTSTCDGYLSTNAS